MPISLNSGNPFFYTEEYKTIIRSCKEILLSRASFSPFVDDSLRFAYRNNFHKLLRRMGGMSSLIPEDMIWTISYLNGIENPNQDFSHLKGIYTITRENINSVIQVTRVRREN